MASLRGDIEMGATWISEAMRSSGYAADFGPPSLWAVDRFLDDHATAGLARSGGLLATDLGTRLFSLGAYTGEVIRRNVGGEWRWDEDPQAEINVELVLPDGAVIWPVQRVMKRFKNGPEDGIAAYGAAFGLEVGPPQASRKRKLFGR